MNPLQRKAKTVEMKNSNDHHDARGGIGRRLRRPRVLIYAAVAAGAAAVLVAGASARQPALGAPKGLQAFNLRVGDSVPASAAAPTFSRTPSFAWAPVRGATRYEFELSTSKRFRAENGVIWSSQTLTTPAASVPISLPWITGDPASLYWHVRALAGGRVSSWSATGRFNMRWTDGIPRQLTGEPGLVKWTPIAGATGYDVWFLNLGNDTRDGHGLLVGKIFSTVTTVADEREYTTERTAPSVVLWRVRARRQLYGSTKNGLPRVSYGPWSRVYAAPGGGSAVTAPIARPLRTVSSDATSSAGASRAHSLMPVFVFSNDGYQFHRVVIATDRDCVNVVHVGSIVGGTAYAPRSSGPLALGGDQWDATHSFLLGGDEGKTLRADGESATTNEAASKGSSSGAKQGGAARVDLWDSNWPHGRYYWTVLPVARNGAGGFQDVLLPQDACQAGSVLQFGKKSANPALSSGAAPFVTGLSPNGRLRSAAGRRSSFYGVPLVAWTPAAGAVGYDVEWSHTRYPWRVVGRGRTYSTSAMLPLRPGSWWYRVRGIDPWLPGNKRMSWSDPVRVLIAKPTFRVAGG